VTAVLECKDLGRYYGQVVGLNELSTTLTGGVIGLVGPNGAGKSTLLRLIVGEIEPSRGELRVLGEKPFANRELYRKLGFCPQQDALYEDMSGFEIVHLLLRLGGFSPADARARAEHALARLSLTERMHSKVRTYSKGMRQRVRIAQAIAHEPQFLVLDEPMTGLDPLGRREVLELLRALGASGTHVLFSSHILYEVEHLTAEIVLIHRGRLLAKGALPEVRALLSKHPRRVELGARRARELAQVLIGCEEVLSVRVGASATSSPGNGAEDRLSIETRAVGPFFRRLNEVAARERYGISAMHSADASLEAVFDYLIA
jgi:ABC-2 type transport system ATP-binding protein